MDITFTTDCTFMGHLQPYTATTWTKFQEIWEAEIKMYNYNKVGACAKAYR